MEVWIHLLNKTYSWYQRLHEQLITNEWSSKSEKKKRFSITTPPAHWMKRPDN